MAQSYTSERPRKVLSLYSLFSILSSLFSLFSSLFSIQISDYVFEGDMLKWVDALRGEKQESQRRLVQYVDLITSEKI